MDFIKLFDGQEFTKNPFAAKIDGKWIAGEVSVDFLQKNFGQCETVDKMKAATTSEGLKLFFDYLIQDGKLN
jgi:hypothetical protein